MDPAAYHSLVGCGSGAGGADGGTTAAEVSTDGRFPVGADQRQIALRCWGDKSPTVVWDAGIGAAGIGWFEHSPIVRELAAHNRVCTYDRAGLGESDAAPRRRRGLDDAVDDLHGLLQAAQVPGPYVLVGSSGGGFIVYHYSGRYPDEVAGLVMLDVPPGHARVAAAEVPAWDNPSNTEHIDFVAIERQMALDRLPIPAIPVTVITASSGLSADPNEQRVWLEGSSHPVQVVLQGGHAIHDDDPAGIRAEITKVLERAESN